MYLATRVRGIEGPVLLKREANIIITGYLEIGFKRKRERNVYIGLVKNIRSIVNKSRFIGAFSIYLELLIAIIGYY
mgnify:CR=1 FL=1|jgi:hypothetical protein